VAARESEMAQGRNGHGERNWRRNRRCVGGAGTGGGGRAAVFGRGNREPVGALERARGRAGARGLVTERGFRMMRRCTESCKP